MKTTTIDLIRHGEPRGGRLFRGSQDDPLSATGWAQMRTAVAHHCPWQRIVSSPLLRCAEFATELAERHRLPLEIDHGFRELGFGDWEGLSAEQVEAGYPGALATFWREPESYTPPGAEAVVEFDARVAEAWQGLLKRHAGQHVLLVCHGGVIRMCVRQVLGLPSGHIWRMDVPYAGVSRVRVHLDAGQPVPVLEYLNGTLAA
ncbi:histidine phosphatase family protein [Plasticicumulans acidivorans]|uniref:Alpha-ribazole phosphatase/probable phosphoglycerate mutase n=1 Tax=Plasticicumulans acidivorans TaxID=886464 RepID=A0A317MYF1_9GAMM|nr:histidine phosphatase family protein [Plasticicumulans acidivorans]PWV64461.1 alpha-ribazole phosphatase/probable phosphoglycerate mutase [Plasticicumulans acidivorans]